ncbi:hypothetical protein FA15DRAFT_670238 [Coprinopsis marcescibilis]|uniref:Uncharacterized protein n=1 Tax=Coprinopsis marcescibilis TaxID=230819 RepID=A0A5C3KSU1_COPMA|nr:hypothetical protein FA15DRAFT_670238 [Coprinopsis marcescibilis]
MASKEFLEFSEPRAPRENGIEAFNNILPTIKNEILGSRSHWDKHEPKMWSRATRLTNAQLVDFTIEKDLIEIRSATTSYGNIILGKIRIPAVQDEEGEGFIHVRIHDPPNRGTEDVIFHSLFTDEGSPDADGRPTTWRAIQTDEKPLEFFHE